MPDFDDDSILALIAVVGAPRLTELVDKLEIDAGGLLAELAAAVSAGNDDQRHAAAHRLSGMLALFGARAAEAGARRIETMGKGLSPAAGEIDALCGLVDAAVRGLKARIAKYSG